MFLLKEMSVAVADTLKGEMALFEKIMQEKIEKDGYTIKELMFDVYLAQKEIAALKEQVASLKSRS